eukprot:SAG31_NODE_9535_length_1262_cov_2.288048_2_plen_81_part_00
MLELMEQDRDQLHADMHSLEQLESGEWVPGDEKTVKMCILDHKINVIEQEIVCDRQEFEFENDVILHDDEPVHCYHINIL